MPSFVRPAAAALFAMAVVGCGDLTGPESLPEARQLWDDQNLSTYQYVGTRTAFIGAAGPVTVFVVNDQVVTVVDESGAFRSTSGWLTIDALFDSAEQAIANDELNRIEFDEDAGYPTLVDTGDWALDGGTRRTVSDLQSSVTPNGN